MNSLCNYINKNIKNLFPLYVVFSAAGLPFVTCITIVYSLSAAFKELE